MVVYRGGLKKRNEDFFDDDVMWGIIIHVDRCMWRETRGFADWV